MSNPNVETANEKDLIKSLPSDERKDVSVIEQINENQRQPTAATCDNADSDISTTPRNHIWFRFWHWHWRTIYTKIMFVLCREFFFILPLVLTYAALHNKTPKVSKSPVAFPFFPNDSMVKDWYRGELNEAIELSSKSDLAFVMYYAPWDAESQTVRHQFDIAAQHMHRNVHFAAINCWQPGSECRSQYNKIYTWPVLMAYPANGRGIHYRGPRQAEHIIKFLQSVMKPLIRVSDQFEYQKYLGTHDALAVGFVDVANSSNYNVYYNLALKYLERDPFRDLCFVIIIGTEENLRIPGGEPVPKLDLYLWNETVTYPEENEWRSDSMLSWLNEKMHQPTVWVSVTGVKSHSLASYLQPGPALILFTPRNPLHNYNDYYGKFRVVSFDYHNCNKDMKTFHKRLILELTLMMEGIVYTDLQKKCIQIEDQIPTIKTCNVHNLWLNNTCESHTDHNSDTCNNFIHPTTFHNQINRFSDHKFDYVNETNDPRSPENLQRLAELEECYYFNLAHQLHPATFMHSYVNDRTRRDFIDLSCKTNLSLTFLALDSMQYHHFAEGLGIDILNKKDKTAVVIINTAFETHYVMKGRYTVKNLVKFVENFTNGQLGRTLSSTSIPRLHTHHYAFSELCSARNACVRELITADFLPTVLKPNVAVIVFYYSTKCAFCSGVSYMFLTAAQMLSSVKDLHFTRIDGDNHALPWEYTMHHYPSILFFPAKKKSESRVFPQNIPITVPNIFSFLLANVESNLRLRIMWTLCKETAMFETDFEHCIRTIRIETMTMIGKLLRIYRFTTDHRNRTELLKHLQLLRSLHLILEDATDSNAIQKQFSLLRSFDVSLWKHQRKGML